MIKMLIIFMLVFIVSCSTAEIKIYSIYMPIQEEILQSLKQQEILFLVVRSPKHLDQPYIIYRSSPFELNISSYAKWEATPLDIIRHNIVEILYSQRIYKEVKTLRPQVNEKTEVMIVDLKDFSRYDEDKVSYALLHFSVLLKDKDNKEIFIKDFKIKEKLNDKTYLSLARGMSQAITKTLQEVAKMSRDR
ncbi:MAG TPA: hypothetical protein HPP56_00280 [Nitrospirae bacterium]|nr:hypothetical protein [Nitrospirota bacterium]